MQEDIENKSLTLIINTSKLTARTLATAFMKLVTQNQGVEKTELADREEVKIFDRYAKQYGVDYAIKKGISQDGKPRYMLFFKARDRAAIDQAMAAYAANWAKKHKQERSPIEAVLDPVKEMLPGHKKERIRQKGMER